jgi:hypothetical protein
VYFSSISFSLLSSLLAALLGAPTTNASNMPEADSACDATWEHDDQQLSVAAAAVTSAKKEVYSHLENFLQLHDADFLPPGKYFLLWACRCAYVLLVSVWANVASY